MIVIAEIIEEEILFLIKEVNCNAVVRNKRYLSASDPYTVRDS